jgi:hypothetical protein
MFAWVELEVSFMVIPVIQIIVIGLLFGRLCLPLVRRRDLNTEAGLRAVCAGSWPGNEIASLVNWRFAVAGY